MNSAVMHDVRYDVREIWIDNAGLRKRERNDRGRKGIREGWKWGIMAARVGKPAGEIDGSVSERVETRGKARSDAERILPPLLPSSPPVSRMKSERGALRVKK